MTHCRHSSSPYHIELKGEYGNENVLKYGNENVLKYGNENVLKYGNENVFKYGNGCIQSLKYGNGFIHSSMGLRMCISRNVFKYGNGHNMYKYGFHEDSKVSMELL